MFRFTCPGCKAGLTSKALPKDGKAKCPKCGQILAIPTQIAEAQPIPTAVPIESIQPAPPLIVATPIDDGEAERRRRRRQEDEADEARYRRRLRQREEYLARREQTLRVVFDAPGKKKTSALSTILGFGVIMVLSCAGINACFQSGEKARVAEVQRVAALTPEQKAAEAKAKKDAAAALNPLDDLQAFISKYGEPDRVESTENDNPPPQIITKFLIYSKENARASYFRGDDGAWHLIGFQYENTKEVMPAKEAAKALQSRKSKIDPDLKGLQKERKKLIDTMVREGSLQKIKSDKKPFELWVTPRFMGMGPGDQEAYASCVFDWVFQVPEVSARGSVSPDAVLTLRHSVTGKRVGVRDRNGFRME